MVHRLPAESIELHRRTSLLQYRFFQKIQLYKVDRKRAKSNIIFISKYSYTVEFLYCSHEDENLSVSFSIYHAKFSS